MAFISKENPVVLNIMLTSKGRERLSTGNLTFKYFTVGDSEIDYNFVREVDADPNVDYNSFNSSILRPRDKNPMIVSYIPKDLTGSSYNEIGTLSTTPYDVVNEANSLGFFINSGNTYITQPTHIKQPDIQINVSGLTGGTSIDVRKSALYGNSVLEPNVNDYLYIKWVFSGNSTGHTVNKNIPIPNLIYKIISKTGTLAADTLNVTLDRDLPNLENLGFSGLSGAMVFYSDMSETSLLSTDYLDESVLTFIQNYQCGIANYPFWNMSIIYTEEIAGIQTNDRKFTQFNTKTYGGFVSYIQNQSPYYKKLGVIHYTNNSPANTYGEEFNLNSPRLEIPTVMWHKSSSDTMGLTLVATGGSKLLTGSTKSLNVEYYDLADETSGEIVGKIFNGLKIFVIEDQELLYAMSYKSNRSWTLPDFVMGTGDSNPCPPSESATILTPTVYPIDEQSCDLFVVTWSISTTSNGSAVMYAIYGKDSENDSWELLQDGLNDPIYEAHGLNEGIVYNYKVIAYTDDGLTSTESNIVSKTVRCISFPSAVIMNEISELECDSFQITWSESTADNPPVIYNLYYKINGDAWKILVDNLNDTTYIHSNLNNGSTYSYKVIVLDNHQTPSPDSNIVSKLVDCG